MNVVWKNRAKHFWLNWAKPVVVTIALLSTFRSAIADWNVVPTGSMRPTIIEGDRIFVNKLAYDLKLPFTQLRLATWGQPERGDVIVLYSPADGTRLVKRVVGIPGDTLELRNNRLLVNGSPADYEALDPSVIQFIESQQRPLHQFATETVEGRGHAVMLTPRVGAPKTFAPLVVPADQFFVMGDNRDQSGDSRIFGFVPRSGIVGRSSWIVLSLNRDRYFLPRFNRFFRGLP